MKKEETFEDMLIEEFGEDIIYRDDPNDRNVEVIPTGSLSLDMSIGVGGIPVGKFTEIYGPESSSKTSLCLSISKEAIKLGKNVLYVEPENMLDFNYIEALVGTVDPDKFLLVKPETSEQSLKICEKGIESGKFGLIVLDSIGGLAPEKEKKDELGDAHYSLVSRILTSFLRRNAYKVRMNNVAFIFINQVRDKIGSPVPSYETPGGHALKHYLSLRIMLSKSEDIKKVSGDNKETIGIYSKYVIKKNKLAPPFKTFMFPLIFGKGVDSTWDIINFAELLGILVKRGSYYTFEGRTVGQGMANTVEYLNNNPETLDKIKTMCYDISMVMNNKKKEAITIG